MTRKGRRCILSVVAVYIVVVAAMLIGNLSESEAVTCNAMELSPCIGVITSGQPPSPQCCTKMREQRPCLCTYVKDPNLKQYVNSPNARKVASSCGVPAPKC